MAGGRGFYRIGSEDHITSALFQNWALFPDMGWVAALVHAVGGMVGSVRRVRWAYECNELLDARLQPFHKRNFIIPDIMLVYGTEYGYREIEALPIPDGVRRFLKGSECVEAVWNGRRPDPVLPWLTDEPEVEEIRQRGRQKRAWQTNEDRMVCRWSFNWDQSRERTWR